MGYEKFTKYLEIFKHKVYVNIKDVILKKSKFKPLS